MAETEPIKTENSSKLLPNPFQNAAATPPPSVDNSNANATTHLHGYRSNFNVNHQKQMYQQQRNPKFERRQPFNKERPHGNNNYQHKQNYPQGKFNKNASNEGNNNNWCSLCEQGFKYPQQLQKHTDEHEKCWFENCNFEGHTKLLQKHIEIQHNSGLFQKIGKVETDEDIEKWREERRKRYPTQANIEARRLAQEERLKRGERLEEPKNRFGNMRDRKGPPNRPKVENKNKERNEKKKRNRKSRNNRNKKNSKDDGKPKEEKSEISDGNLNSKSNETITSQPTNQSTTNALAALVGFYGSDSENESGPEESNIVKNDEENTAETKRNVDEIGSQSDDNDRKRAANEPIDDEIPTKQIKPIGDGLMDDVPNDANASTENVHSALIEEKNESVSDDEPPEEQSIAHKNSDESEANNNSTCKIFQPSSTKASEAAMALKKKTIFDMTRKIRNQNSLLEKLLQKDIRHERNVLLQCVRYVVEKNFFGIGEETKKIEEDE